MQRSFNDAVTDVTEIMQFENWLRFYFVIERDDALYIEVPDEALAKIQEIHPVYSDLVELFNHKQIDYETSMRTVCEYVVRKLDGSIYREGLVPAVLDSNEFRMRMHLFNTWVQSHEEQLDQTFLDFTTWVSLHEEWKNSDQVKRYFEKAHQTPSLEDDSPMQ
ncbi:MAG: hypothetical protein AB7E47_07645 [Desulfovibrionaceae bacterium]